MYVLTYCTHMPVLHTYVHMCMYELSYHGTFVGHYMSMSKMETLYTASSVGVSDKRQHSLDITPSASFHCYGAPSTTIPRRHFYDGASTITIMCKPCTEVRILSP